MGCDIHAKIEYQWLAKHERGPTSEWRNYAMDVDLGRWYLMFGAMVDGHSRRRTDQRGVVPERGYPADADTDHIDWELDPKVTADHTFSWLTTAEFRKAIEMAEAWCAEHAQPWCTEPTYAAALAAMEALEAGGLPARLVFGFDN